MPVALTFNLRTGRPWKPDTRQLHGLACALFETPDTDHEAPVKLFTVQEPIPDTPTSLSLHASWYGEGALPEEVTRPRTVRLGNTRCVITRATSCTRSFTELARGEGVTRATLTFHSPTYFTRSGEPDLTPDPALILGSHRRSWNTAVGANSPLRTTDDAWQNLRQALRIEGLNITTARRDSGYAYPRPGFTGSVTLRLARNATPQTQQLFAALIRFAPYAGTGAGTTHGFGATTSRLPGQRRSKGGPQPTAGIRRSSAAAGGVTT